MVFEPERGADLASSEPDETQVFDGWSETPLGQRAGLEWDEFAATEASLSSRIREFEPGALLRVLGHMGYEHNQIMHTGVCSTSSQKSLIDAITFETSRSRVLIHWNLGLLSSQSPLPSYFFKKMESGEIDSVAFTTFLGFFDQILIRRYWAGVYPDSNPRLFPDWGAACRRTLNTKNFCSPDALQWICQSFFPELRVSVERCTTTTEVHTREMRLGEVSLGDGAVFGQRASVAVEALRINIICDRPTTASGENWAVEIRRRLSVHVFPVLAPLEMEVELVQVIQRLGSEGASLSGGSYLGFERIHGDTSSEGRVVLFRGRIST